MSSDGISLRPLVDHIQDVLDQVCELDLPPELQVERTRTLKTLKGVRSVVRGLCFSDEIDCEYVICELPD